MTKDEIVRMAKEAGAVFPGDGSYHCFEIPGTLERFAAMIATYEREECVKVCEKVAKFHQVPLDSDLALDLTSAIKARGIKLRGQA